jgi:tetratricopeptide (TPR) repeat protein
MDAMRDWRIAAAAVLLGAAIFDGSVPWVGLGALVLALALALPALAGRGPRPQAALLPLGALVAFVAWQGVSVAWSVLPDRSWDYLNLGLVYLAFAACGVLLGTRRLAPALALVLGATVAWALLGKIFPGLYPDYARTARLRAPVDYWNALALLGDFALPLGLWLATRTRARLAGLLLVFGWIVAILLAFSRGGVLVGAVVCAAWLALDDRRAASLWALLVAGLPAAAAGGLAFLLDGVTADGQSDAARTHDGRLFGLLLLAGILVVAALSRVRVRERLLAPVVAAALVAAVVAVALNAGRLWDEGPVGSGPARVASASSNFRVTWWKQAARGFADRPALGSGAGSFAYTNLKERTTSFDRATEPHDLPLQFASETGIVGLALFLALVAAAAAALRPRSPEERALALVPLAYLLHGLLDYDWDFVAVTGPALLVLGALLARPAASPRRNVLGAVAAVAAAVACFGSLLLPWLAERKTLDALAEPPARVLELTDEARSLDPLAVEPIFLAAEAQRSLGRKREAWSLYLRATRVQPDNKETWFQLGQFELELGCPRYALPHLQRFTELDPQGPGGELYREALTAVNSGKARC